MTCALSAIPALAMIFLDPLDLHDEWLILLPPLVFAIALVYKTLKLPTLERLAYETVRLGAYILVLIVLAAATLWAVVEIM